MDFKPTTNKLGSSRLLKLALIGIGVLLFIKILSYIMIGYVIYLTSNNTDTEIIRVYSTIIDTLNISIATAISSIIVAIVARYGLRESTINLKKSEISSSKSD